MAPHETFYEVLGVGREASETDVERAYRARVKEYHPDVSDRPDARERIKRVNRAREVLTDTTERARYDRLGHRAYLARERTGTTPRDGTGDRAGAPESDGSTDGTAGSETRETRYSATNPATDETGTRQTTRGESHAAAGRSRRARDTGSGTRRGGEQTSTVPGRFAFREALSAVTLALVAAGLGTLIVSAGAAGPDGWNETAFLLGGWALVAAVAGRLAAGGARLLPDDVVRAQALPLALFVAAWYAAQLDRYEALVAALIAYGSFAALFRTAALASGRDASTLRSTALWFVGATPPMLALYARYVGSGGTDATLAALTRATAPAVVNGDVAVAAVPVGVSLAYAAWRLVWSLR